MLGKHICAIICAMEKQKQVKTIAKSIVSNLSETVKVIATNKKAFHNYIILSGIEAGIVLQGTEIKSLRQGRVSIVDAFVREEKGQMWLYNAHIAQYSNRGYSDHEPTRPRKLLLQGREIEKLKAESKEKGLTIVVTKLYFKKHLAKAFINLAKGKKLYDKREDAAKKDWGRTQDRMLKNNL